MPPDWLTPVAAAPLEVTLSAPELVALSAPLPLFCTMPCARPVACTVAPRVKVAVWLLPFDCDTPSASPLLAVIAKPLVALTSSAPLAPD